MSTVHDSAIVSDQASIGEGTSIWHFAVVREGVTIGDNCIIGGRAYVDSNVQIGNNCKIQNNTLLYRDLTVEDGVFIGPGVIIANDKVPRAINQDGSLKAASDWECGKTVIKKGAAIGAGSVLLPGLTIGEFAMVGAGSVVTKDVPDGVLVVGNPAKEVGPAPDLAA